MNKKKEIENREDSKEKELEKGKSFSNLSVSENKNESFEIKNNSEIEIVSEAEDNSKDFSEFEEIETVSGIDISEAEDEEDSFDEVCSEKKEKPTIIENNNAETKEALEQVKEAEETVTKQKGKKKKLISILGMLVNIGIVVYILVSQLSSSDSVMPLPELLASSFSWGCFFLCIFAFFALNTTNAARFDILIRKTTKRKRFILGYKVAAMGKYYDCITPLSAGGEPYQIYYLNKRGIDASGSLSIPMGFYCIHQIAYVIFSIIFMLCGTFFLTFEAGVSSALVMTSGWIGLSFNFALMAVVAIISINRKIGTKIVTGFLKFFKKIKIIKNYDKQYARVMRFVDDYQTTMKKYATDKKTFILTVLITIISLFIQYSIPFLVYATLSGGFIDTSVFWEIFIKCLIVDMASSFIPIPGGSGAAELSFTTLFMKLFAGGTLFWALLLWRFLTYYGYIIQGMTVQLYDFFKGNRRFEWLAKKWELEAESDGFKKEQMKSFEHDFKKIEKNRFKTRK